MSWPAWANRVPREKIEAASEKYQLDPVLVASVVMTESGGNAKAARYEKGYHWVTDTAFWAKKCHITEATELMLQSCSWGLMQVMGATARDVGYTGFIPDLCIPELGLDVGCHYLHRLMVRHGSINDAVAAYNAGSVRISNGKYDNQEYVDRVAGWMRK